MPGLEVEDSEALIVVLIKAAETTRCSAAFGLFTDFNQIVNILVRFSMLSCHGKYECPLPYVPLTQASVLSKVLAF